MRLKFCCALFILITLKVNALAMENPAGAQKDSPVDKLLSEDSASACCVHFEQLKEDYFKDKRYLEFYDFLDSLKLKDSRAQEPCVDYYKALASYEHLKYLEEEQSWDEYFDKGNTYRQQITENAQKAVEATACGECLNLKGQLLLWQFHRDQQDVFHEQALNGLLHSLTACPAAVKDPRLIKEIGDKFFSYGEKSLASQVYKIYVDRLVSAGAKPAELLKAADDLYAEGNLELAENIYDMYMDKITLSWDEDKLIPELMRISDEFVYKREGYQDPFFAEKIFKRIEALGADEASSEDFIYQRAFNLEKAKDYEGAADLYGRLAALYPDSVHYEEALYKTALIEAYVLADLEAAGKNLEILSGREDVSAYVISALYQSGVFAQYGQDLAAAKDFYSRLLERASGAFPETEVLAKKRMDEIEENKTLEYNLKAYLDIALKESGGRPGAGKSELILSDYLPGREEEMNISSETYIPESGCMQVELQYLWSGDTGSTIPSANEAGFQTSYSDEGTKELTLVIVSAGGPLGFAFDMLDVR